MSVKMAFRDKLTRFHDKSPRDKWLAIRATLGALAQKIFRADRTNKQILIEIKELRTMSLRSFWLAKEQYLALELSRERYADPKRLERYGYKVYSQCDEDGIIQEIFHRIGSTNRRFVEFGVENGLENNTLKMLLEGWAGLWIDGNAEHVKSIEKRFSDVLADNRLAVQLAFITAENINELISAWGTGEVDLLSIDIDGNDLYVWQAINVISPRVVVIEFNSKFPPPLSIVQEYDPMNVWRGTDYMGASLEALTRLGRRLGYSLVGTTLMGLNAFFVRSDLVADYFQIPHSAENHFNAHAFLWPYYTPGHAPDWGRYVEVDGSGSMTRRVR
jgi:hypothetical protein